MTTTRDIIDDALRILRIVAAEEDPTAYQAAKGLRKLNQFMHALKSRNADVGYQNLTLDDALPVPPEHDLPITYALAAELAPTFGTELTPEAAVKAREAIRTLQAYYRRSGQLFPDAGIQDRLSHYASRYDINTDV